PALAEPDAAEEVGGRGDPVLVPGPVVVGERVVREREVARVLVEPGVVAEGAEAEEIVRRLPGVAAERVTDEVAGEDDTRHRSEPRVGEEPRADLLRGEAALRHLAGVPAGAGIVGPDGGERRDRLLGGREGMEPGPGRDVRAEAGLLDDHGFPARQVRRAARAEPAAPR